MNRLHPWMQPGLEYDLHIVSAAELASPWQTVFGNHHRLLTLQLQQNLLQVLAVHLKFLYR